MIAALVMLALSAGDVQAVAGCGIFDEFVFSGSADERAGVEHALDVALEPMFFAVRSIARGKLRAGTHVSTTIKFRKEGALLVADAEGTQGARSDAGGAPSYFLYSGARVILQQHAEPTRISQTFTTRSGGRENVYILAPETGRVTLSVKITAPQLPKPVSYTLTYARSPHSTCQNDNERARAPLSIAGE